MEKLKSIKIASLVLAGISGAAPSVVLPAILASLAHQRGYSGAQVAYIASAEMAGLALATFGVFLVIGTINRRVFIRAALLLLILLNLGSYFSYSFPFLLITRMLAGITEGALLAVAAAAIMATAQPDRIFAIYVAMNMVTSTVFLDILSALDHVGRARGVFVALIAFAGLTLAFSQFFPAYAVKDDDGLVPNGPVVRYPKSSAWYGLGGTFLMFLGLGVSWPLLGQYGVSLSISPGIVASLFSYATAAGVISGILASLLGDRIGRRIPVILSSLLVAIALVMLTQADDSLTFGLGLVTFLIVLVWVFPYYTSTVSVLDSRGHLASLSVGLQYTGFAVGPLIGAYLLRYGFSTLLAVAAILCIPAAGLMALVKQLDAKSPLPHREE